MCIMAILNYHSILGKSKSILFNNVSSLHIINNKKTVKIGKQDNCRSQNKLNLRLLETNYRNKAQENQLA